MLELAIASPAARYFGGAYGKPHPALGEPMLPAEGCSPSAGGEVEAPLASSPAYAECYCGRVEAFDRDVGLPAGWRPAADGSSVKCPDCASSSRLDELQAAGADQVARLFAMKGARINAELHPRIRVATLRIRAGLAARPGARDDGALFVADRGDLRALITGLEAIDRDLAAATPAPRT